MSLVGREFAAEEPDRSRAPAAPVACAAMAGIVADRLLDGPVAVWLALVAFGIAGGLGAIRSPWLSSLVVLAGWGGLFGLWHHAWWGAPRPGDVFHVATDAGMPVVLRGRTVQPSWLHTMADGQPETLAVVACEALLQPDGRARPVSGVARLQILRTKMTLAAGSQVRVVGRLQRPPVAMNPDGFDYRQWLRMRGITALLRADTAEAVVVEAERPSLWNRLQNSRHELRESAVAALSRARRTETAVIGEALLLGSRNRMPDELREAFAESGVLHVLAISGINVSIIWLGLLLSSRALGLSLPAGSWIVIVGLGGYAWLADANPPIVRAATFAIVMQAAELAGRRMALRQALSLALLVVLALNPTDLFNAGAQLSFLSVAVLSAVNQYCTAHETAALDEMPDQPSPWRKLWRVICSGFFRANLTTGAVWLATAPLVAWRFHLVSLAGLGLNVLLGPLVLFLLWTGYLWLLVFLLSPTAATWLLSTFEWQLHVLLTAARAAASWPYGHWYLPGPPDWWVLGFYLLLAAAWWLRPAWPRLRQLGVLLLWTNLGLAWGLWPAPAHPLICEVIAVRHGLAVVVHCPNGRTLGYDVGCLAGGEYAAAAVCDSVWRTGSRRMDALVVSHPDADHCNGIPALAERLSVGTMALHRTFLDFDQPPVVQALEAWHAAGGRFRLIAAGDRIELDSQVTISVWHPAEEDHHSRDNANSIVLLVEYAGRRVLLTGDLEREGLAALLTRPRSPVDFLLSPHHGSKVANSAELAAWTNPAIVAVSSSDRLVASRLRPVFAESTAILNTAECGAIRCEITADGELSVATYLTPP